LEEAFALVNKVTFKPKRNSNRHIYYYDCASENDSYRTKITENRDLINELTTTSLISNFKNFDTTKISELSEGICSLTEYREHYNNHEKDLNNKVETKKFGKSYK